MASQLFLLLFWQWLICLSVEWTQNLHWKHHRVGKERWPSTSVFKPKIQKGLLGFCPRCLISAWAHTPTENHKGDYTNAARSLTCHLFSKLCLKVKCHFLDFLLVTQSALMFHQNKENNCSHIRHTLAMGEKKKEKQFIITRFGKGKEPGCVPRRQISIISTPIIYFRNMRLPWRREGSSQLASIMSDSGVNGNTWREK